MLSYNINKIMEKLKPSEKDDLYKELWFEHIKKRCCRFRKFESHPCKFSDG